MKRRKYPPLSLSLSFISLSLLFLLPSLLSLLSPSYPSIGKSFWLSLFSKKENIFLSVVHFFSSSQFSFYLHEKEKKILSLSLSLSLSFITSIPSLSSFSFPPHFPSIHFLLSLFIVLLIISNLSVSQSEPLSIYMKGEKKKALSQKEKFFLLFPPYLSKTFLSKSFLALSQKIYLHEKEKKSKERKKENLSFMNVHSFSLFFLLPTLQYIPSLIIS
ncbi:unnamed protein product [Acanthosepion pharaonis]|uniref:Transmembrane protein n=1 Tax=Acanthosepion pharaonis TaxID=158019 RepID=A0A812EKH6_ACAPH|nr:unnamed protein product [Sepia pharaonis]